VSHSPQKSGNLATVMGSVIGEMQHKLPDWVYKWIAFRILVGNILLNGVFSQQSTPLFPPLEQRRPVIPEHLQMHILLRNHIACRGISLDSAKPSSISSVDVNKGAKNAVIGGGKISCQFLRTQRTCSFNQSAAGPGGVVQMVSEYVYRGCHKCEPVYTSSRRSENQRQGQCRANFRRMPWPRCFLLDR